MNRRDTLLDKARRNPKGLQFREFERLMRQCEWTQRWQRGSHRTWYSPKGHRLIVQPDRSMEKGYQVRQFLKQYNQEEIDEEK